MANGLIGKVTAGGGTHLIASTAYFTCATAGATVAKIAKAVDTSLDSFTAITGITIYVKFDASNTAINPTLTLQTNGGTQLLAAKPIMRYGTTAIGNNAQKSWKAGGLIALTYDGTNWIEVSSSDPFYEPISIGNLQAGTETTSRLVNAARIKAAFLGDSTNTNPIFKTGETNGTIAVYGTDIAVKGLGSLAYKSTFTPNTPTSVTKKTVVTSASVSNEILTISTGDSVTVTAGTAASVS